MAPAATLAVFLLCCCFFSATDSQDVCDLYAATGTNVTVRLRYTLNETVNLKWLKDATVIFMRRNKKVITGKKDDVDSTGSLKLTQLTTNNKGRYTPEVHGADGVSVGDLQSTRLCVLDRVQKPKVTMTCLDSKKNVRFTCSVGQNEKLEWFMDDKNLTENKKILTKVASTVANARFYCKVSNPVSSEISLPVQQNCYEPSFPDELWGISIWVFVGGGAGVVLVLILIVIICCIQTKRKRRMRLKDEGELRLQWSNQERQHQQQHHHHQHQQHQHQHQNHPDQHQHQHPHHHQQQPAGNTGPRQPRSKQQRAQQRPRAPDPPNGHPQPSPRRAAQASRPADNNNEEQPPPLPQPRKKKAPKE
ncbi:T-cell surface antigen CD2 [Archocentrus centrarchus]|uniref:T-cell surface antigen CD2 n=1 Tax=Archocentrus centrarchus TaxID=63155 RepID=UPI0011E9C89A|nr:T-cell surface antigen CD2 [Archocentrus centrarchus]